MKETIKLKTAQSSSVNLEIDLIRENQKLAERNRELFRKNKIKAVDIMGSVGTGKTSLIEQLVRKLKRKYKIAVVNGDLTTTIDADIIGKHKVNVIQINTGKECHLDAKIVKKAIDHLKPEKIELILIENVGNLICPADFELGSDMRLLVVAVTEGPYVAVKHPLSFLNTDIVAINKIDLADILSINVEKLERDIEMINPKLKIVRTDCKNGIGIDKLIEALKI